MPVALALPYIATAATVAGTVSSISSQRKALSAQKDALAQQRDIAANLKYEPINIENLKEQTRQQAIQNATQSLALERELSPDVAATRQMVAERVRTDLGLGGQLSPDVASQVARAARVSGSLSGAPAAPLTASLIGTTAENLRQQRLANAGGLLAQNKLQPAGLDPGALASLIVSQNAAMNQFNAAKAGVNANLAQSAGQVGAAGAATQQSITGQALNALPGIVSGLGGLFSSPSTSGGTGLGLTQTYNPLAGAASFSVPAAATPSLSNYSFGTTASPFVMPTTLLPTPGP